MTARLLGGAGGLETSITTLAAHHQTLSPTINVESQDPECDPDYAPNELRRRYSFNL